MALLGLNYMISKTIIAFLFLFTFLSKHANALVPSNSKDHHFCKNGTFDPDQQSKLSTTSLLSDLVAHSSSNRFYASSSSASGPNLTTYGLFFCTANVPFEDCHNCVQYAASEAQLNCASYKGAVLIYTNCTLRYSNITVYGTLDMSVGACLYSTGISSIVSYPGFNNTLYATLNSLIKEAAYASGSKGYATGEASLAETSKRLYALVQCTPDILGNPCQECLDRALRIMPRCSNDGIWGPQRTRILTHLPSCQLRYEVKYPELSTSDGTLSYSLGKIWYVVIAMAGAALALH